MKVPLRWLQEIVDIDVSPQDLAHRLTMAGLEVEKIDRVGSEWDRVFVGYVHEAQKHPDADRLSLADIEAGEHRLVVVTGAPNIATGQKVALALSGARLIDGHSDSGETRVLKPVKMRGILSEGMACSEKELGISDEHEGILVLPADAPAGVSLEEYLGDTVLEFEITPNLAHDFSVIGIGRETAALYRQDVRLPEVIALDTLPQAAQHLVTIESPDLYARYVGITFDGIEVGPSPFWLARRLQLAGLRPINNIVDITNYVMLEYGQPLHAFDAGKLAEGRIVVRRAQEGERIETLDHVDRALTNSMLVIADAEKPVAVAGVMGGVESEVSASTTSILLEGAQFDMRSVRHTAKALKLRSDASARFERGVDPDLAGPAMARAVKLILDICPGARVTGVADSYPRPAFRRSLAMPYAGIERVLGISYPRDLVRDVLQRLEFEPRITGEGDDSPLEVSIPTYRADVSVPEDIVEEIARMIGYESLPHTLPRGQAVEVKRDPVFQLQQLLRRVLTGSGLYEAVTYVTVADSMLMAFGMEDGERAGVLRPVNASEVVRLRNPMQSGRQSMRTTLLPSMLESLAANLRHTPGAGLFELARLYSTRDPDALPDETDTLGIVMAGANEPVSQFSSGGTFDFFDLKGVVEELVARAGVLGVSFDAWHHPSFHPGRAATVRSGETLIGCFGELRPATAEIFGVDAERVVTGEFDVNALLRLSQEETPEFQTQRYLPVRQDFAVVVDEQTPASSVADVLREGGGRLLTGLDLFDIYRGPQAGDGRKSLAFRATFTAPDRTLTDGDLIKVRGKIAKLLQSRLAAQLRS